MLRRWVRTVLIGWAALLLSASAVRSAGGAVVDFSRDVRPILADRCFRCHGPDAQARQSGLRLDDRQAAMAAADSGRAAIVPGRPEESELVRRIFADDPSERMPPPESKLALSDNEKEILRCWIAEGASYRGHWSREPLRRPPLPPPAPWSSDDHPVDRFIDDTLRRHGVQPLGPADRYRLIRRVTLDLTGLPPTVQEAEQFVTDASPDAYERLVDRLLASPAFGERMAWDWLDAARYADSNGYQGDAERTMWPWRDWVVSAWNTNLPFDRFTVWQLAGDLLPDATEETRLATGFCRNHMINGEGGRIAEENRVDYVMDITETMATVWLAATMNCARCHDHKYDPFTRRDYYRLFAFFKQTPIDGSGGNPQTPPVIEVPSAEQQQALADAEQRVQRLSAAVADHEQPWTNDGSATALPEEIRTVLKHAPHERDKDQVERLQKFFAERDADYLQRVAALQQAREQRDAVRRAIPRVMVMQDRSEYRPTFMLEKGLYNQPGEEVQPGVPACLPPLSDDRKPNRLALAEWLVSPDNPLTARVIANRFWQQFFGVGLVKTAEDFGAQGELPSHPELLDWLACELRDSGWDVKRFCRLLVTSQAYQRQSQVTAQLREQDPENRLLARGPRSRLASWMIRDQALAVSGLLVHRLGGPPVQPYQPPGVWEDATFGNKKYTQDHGEKLYRRSLYTFWRRIIAPTVFFDSASRQVCTVRPSRTNSPLHALVTLNDVTYVEAARVLAARQLSQIGAQAPAEQLAEGLLRAVLIRPASEPERKILTAAIQRWEQYYSEHPDQAEALLSVGEAPRPSGPVARLAALTAVANTILNLDETLTKE